MTSLRQFGQPLRGASMRAIWVSLLSSSVGDWAAQIALALLVLDRTGSPALSALVVAVSMMPWIGPGQLLATRTAHLHRVQVMVTADLVRAAIYAVLLLHLPVPAILVLAFVASLWTPPFQAGRSALTFEVVPKDDYPSAVALIGMTSQAGIVVGYLVGGVVVALGGYRPALLVDVASYLVSAAMISRVKEHRQRKERESSSAQLRRSFHISWNDLVIRRGAVVLVFVGLSVAAVEATAAAYARLVLHSGATAAGELAAAVPVGVLVAVPLIPRSGGPRRLLQASALVALIGGLVSGGAFGAGHLAGALVGFFGAGILTGAVTPAEVAFQPRIPADDRPAVFSVLNGLAVGMQAAGAAIGGAVATLIGPRHSALVWAGVAVAASLLLLAVPPRLRDDDAGAPKRRTPAHRKTRHRHRRRTSMVLTSDPAVEDPTPETT